MLSRTFASLRGTPHGNFLSGDLPHHTPCLTRGRARLKVDYLFPQGCKSSYLLERRRTIAVIVHWHVELPVAPVYDDHSLFATPHEGEPPVERFNQLASQPEVV